MHNNDNFEVNFNKHSRGRDADGVSVVSPITEATTAHRHTDKALTCHFLRAMNCFRLRRLCRNFLELFRSDLTSQRCSRHWSMVNLFLPVQQYTTFIII